LDLPALCAIVDEAASNRAAWSVPALAHAYVTAGVRLLQIRARHASGAVFLDWCRQARDASRRAGAVLVVNDRVDIALMAGITAVHVGQDDLPARQVRRLLGDEGVIGLSTHTREQVDAACDEPISYVAVGPVFGTRSKDTGYEPVGLELVTYAASRTPLPVVAIGGITLGNAPSVLDAGATTVAVIGDLLEGGDPASRAAEWVRAIAKR
jgi:thiamine-phosphate pyrophosphorylase